MLGPQTHPVGEMLQEGFTAGSGHGHPAPRKWPVSRARLRAGRPGPCTAPSPTAARLRVAATKAGMTGKQINKTWAIHAVECDPAFKREETLTPAATWVNPEDVTLSGMSQTQEDRRCVVPLLRSLGASGAQRRQGGGGGPGLGEAEGIQCLMGTESQFGKMRKFWR